MMFRVFALYQRSRKTLIFVLACFVSELVATSAILVLSFKQADSASLHAMPGDML
jgi:hypothetical protein